MQQSPLPAGGALRPRRPPASYRALPGSEREPLPGARAIGLPPLLRRIEVTLLLRPGQTAAVEQALSPEDQAARPPAERQYLTREALARTYGPSALDLREIRRFARRHGLEIVGRNLGARTVHLGGTIGQFMRAFRVPLAMYRYAGGFYRGRTGPVHLPASVHDVVEGVFGLDNRPAARPHFRVKRQLGGAWPQVGVTSFTPIDLAGLYHFPKAGTGSGQSIGIVELGGGFRRADLAAYFQRVGISAPPQVIAVPVAGGRNRPTGNPGGPDGEVMLDIEVAGAIAPGARIVVYFAPNTDQGFLRAVNRAIHDSANHPSVVSISWGQAEASWSTQSLNAFNAAFKNASLLGVTVCAAAGDGGSSDGQPGRIAHADFPASSPYVLACGGTRVEATGGAITAESVWNDGPSGGAGGGGISDVFPVPAWQSGAGVPPSVNPGHHVGRGSPDVAADADPNSGYQVRVDGQNLVFGGTSAVAPLMSGLLALLSEQLGKSVGYLNPLLYSNLGQSACRDVTTGNNDMTGLVGGYSAQPGWDPASGFGSPNGDGFLSGLRGSPAGGGASPPARGGSDSGASSPPSSEE